MARTMFNIFVGFLFALRAASFNLYPTVDPDDLADFFGISIDCLDALNETIPCDQTLFQMSNTVDSYLWTTENVTNLCTPACIASTAKWWSDVQTSCASENIAAYGKMIPAETITGRFFDGLGSACLQSDMSSSSSASNNSVPCANTTSALTSSAPYSNASSASNTTSSGPSWCLIESQEWTGSDIIRPDCTTDSSDLSCEDPLNVSPENGRIASLYSHDTLCSDCFIKMFHQRISSPYLPDADYSDYLLVQYLDILDVCKATMPGENGTDTSNNSTAPYRNSTTPTSTAALRPSGSSSSNPTTNTTTMSAIDPALSTTTTPVMVTTTVSTVTSTVMTTVSNTTPSTTLPPTIATIVNNAFYLPSPIQSGVASLCAKYAQAQPGDTCDSFAAANGIQLIDLYERNTVLGSQGENCGTDFWVGYYYCVGGTD